MERFQVEELFSYPLSHVVNCTLLEWLGIKCQEAVYEIPGAYDGLVIYKSKKHWFSVLGFQISVHSHNFSLFFLITKHH